MGLVAEVNVDSAKVKVYGWDVNATGGTCELTGNRMSGFALALLRKMSIATTIGPVHLSQGI
jgi:hypothetical protein